MSRAERDAQMVRLYGQGVTLSAIAKLNRLSTTRVRQILVEQDGPDAGAAAAARARAEQDRALALRRAVLDWAHRLPAATVEELVEQSGATHQEVLAALPERERARRKDPLTSGAHRGIYVRSVTQVAADHGMASLTYRQYDQLRRSHHPSSARVRQVLGSWAAACTAAGIRTGSDGRGGGVASTWDAESVLGWVVAYLRSDRPDYTYRDLDGWLRSQEGAPSAQTVRNRSGMSWTQLLAEGNRRVAEENE